MEIKKPYYKVLYSGKNITEDLTLELTQLDYTDKVAGESDDISFTVIDTNGLWRNEWKPLKGDSIQIWLGFIDQLLPAGVFSVDTINISGPPDKVTIRAIAASASKKMRTKKSYAFENQTLKQIAEKIADDNGLELIGTINANYKIKRETQYRKTDLGYLKELAARYGYVFSVRENKMFFSSIYDLEGKDIAFGLHRKDLTGYQLFDSTVDSSYSTSTVKHYNPVQDELYNNATSDFIPLGGTVDIDINVDELNIYDQVESQQQAEDIAKAAGHSKTTMQKTVSIRLPGDPRAISGVNVELSGLGQYSGKYHILESKHTITASGGYITSFKAKNIGKIDSSKWL